MINLFCGFDHREAIGYHVFAHSVLAQASAGVSFSPLARMGVPMGSNAFTLSRFLVPALMQHKGCAIFADASDMVMKDDITKLANRFEPRYALQVVKHPAYQTRNPVKYVGTSMECENRDYDRKNWASLMLINCEHEAWRGITPATLNNTSPLTMLQFKWLDDSEIGELPREWNVLADEGQPIEDARLLHWTAGVPAFKHYRAAPGAIHWHAARAAMERI